MTGEYIIMINGELKTFTEFEDIPMSFEHVIKFSPCFSCGPHTNDEHEEMNTFTDKLQELMKRETK